MNLGSKYEVLITKAELAAMVERLGKEISTDYAGKELVVVCVLKGAAIFFSDLIRQIDLDIEIDFISVASYVGSKSSGVVKILKDLDTVITNKDVLIVEDIIDSGLTLAYLLELFSTRGPRSMKICTAFDKPQGRLSEIDVDYVGMEIPDEFIVGYGLDYDEKFRNLPEVVIYDAGLEEN